MDPTFRPPVLFDVLSAKPRAQRHLCAQRWEIPASAARVMVERMTTGESAVQVARRIVDSGAPTLFPLLIEHGGNAVDRTPSLEAEAAVLRDWHVVVETRDCWQLPADLCVSLVSLAKIERFALVTLLARLDEEDLAKVREERGLSVGGSRPSQIARLRAELPQYLTDTTAVREAAATTARLVTVDVEKIRGVRYIEGSNGLLFVLELPQEELVVTAREVAESQGLAFEDDTWGGAEPSPLAIGELRVAEWSPTSGVITFVSVGALKRALQEPRFAKLVTEQIGERRVLIAPDYSVADAHLELSMLGFEPSLTE